MNLGLCNHNSHSIPCMDDAYNLWISDPDSDGIREVIPACDWHLNVRLETEAEMRY